MTLEHEWDQRSVQFPLDANSVVLDIGAYKGRWSKEISARYGCRVFAFEPQEWACNIARNELAEFPNVRVYNFGLGVVSGHFEMEEFETDGASFVLGHSQRQQSGEGELIAMNDWLDLAQIERGIEHIDLVMMNIEAYEFKLIPYMIEQGIMQKLGYFMCQFHPRNYEQQDEFEAIKKQMAEIMDVHFDYGIMLTCWKARVIADEELGHKLWSQGMEIGTSPEWSSEKIGMGEKIILTQEGKTEVRPAEEPPKPKRKGGRKKKVE